MYKNPFFTKLRDFYCKNMQFFKEKCIKTFVKQEKESYKKI